MAVFDGLVASGTRAGVRLAIDVAKGEREPLSASGRYRETIAELDADRLAHVYVDFDRLLAVAGERVPAAAVGDPEASSRGCGHSIGRVAPSRCSPATTPR